MRRPELIESLWSLFLDYRSNPGRRDLIKQHTADMFEHLPMDGEREMLSSGTTGERRRYLWGPYAHEVGAFYFRVFTHNSGCQDHVVLHYANHFDNPSYHVPYSCPYHPGRGTLVVRSDVLKDPRLLRKSILREHEKVGLHISPWKAKVFMRKGIDLSAFDQGELVFFLTGEKVTDEIREAFAPFEIRDHMRCWDGGSTFYTCEYGHTHWLDMVFDFTLGPNGEVFATDILNKAQEFTHYDTGDRVEWARGGLCQCGMPIDHIRFKDATIPYFETRDGLYSYNRLVALVDQCLEARCISPDIMESVSFGFSKSDGRIVLLYRADGSIHPGKIDEVLNGLVIDHLPIGSIAMREEDAHPGMFKVRRMFELEEEDQKAIFTSPMGERFDTL